MSTTTIIMICIVVVVGIIIGLVFTVLGDNKRKKEPLPELDSALSDEEIAKLLMSSLRREYDACVGIPGEDHGLPRDVTSVGDLDYAARRHLGVHLGKRKLTIYAAYVQLLQ